jgi:hypothetical protein
MPGNVSQRRRRTRHYSEPPEVLNLPGWALAAVELGGVALGGAIGSPGGIVGSQPQGQRHAGQAANYGTDSTADDARTIAYLRRRSEEPTTWEVEDQMRRMRTIENAGRTTWR